MKNLYKILKVSPSSTKEEIRKAYYKLSKDYHPDVSKDSNASEIFIEISEAYKILIDDDKRKKYDSLSSNKSSLDITIKIKIPFSFSLTGGKQSIRINDKLLDIDIPAGIRNGARLRIPDEGYESLNNRGDLFVLISIEPSDIYSLVNNILYKKETIDLKTALFGGKIKISVLGKEMIITIPENIGKDKKIKIKGKGAQNFKTKEFGDLILLFEIEIPNIYNIDKKLLSMCKKKL